MGLSCTPRITLRLPYRSGWFTVGLPTLEFFVLWWGLSVLVFALADWSLPDWAGVLTFLGTIPLSLAACVPSYRILYRLAERGRGVVVLDGDRVRWRPRLRWRSLDLTRPHHAAVAAGASGRGRANASLTLGHSLQIFHLPGLAREEVLRAFPEPWFVDELAVLPQEGLWGFELPPDDPQARCFFFALLERLWENRTQNDRFRLYQKFPWDRRPQPEFTHIRVVEWARRTPAEERLVRELERQFVDGLTGSYARVTPDYLVGYVYESARSKVGGLPDYCCLVPLGHASVEVSLPRPDWKPFLVGHLLKQAFATALSTSAPAGGPYLEHRRYLLARGRGEDGRHLELAFQWYDTADPEWEEAEFLVRFVQSAARRGRD